MLKYLLKELSGVYYEESLPALENCSGKTKAIRKQFEKIAGFQQLIEPTCLYVRLEEKDGAAYLAIDFNTALDQEHGFSVLLYNRTPVGWAGAGEMGGAIPSDASPGSQDDFDSEIAVLAEARSRLADALRAAVDPKSAQAVGKKVPKLIENLESATAAINARINQPDDATSTIRKLFNDRRFKDSGKKLNNQLKRIANDKQLCKSLDPAMKKLSGWDKFKRAHREQT